MRQHPIRSALIIVSIAFLAMICASQASAASVAHQLRVNEAAVHGIPVSRVNVAVLSGFSFEGYYCRLNNTEYLFGGTYWVSFGVVGGNSFDEGGTTVPCNHNVDQQPFV